MNFYFVYDEYTDVMDKDGAQRAHDIVMDAFRNPGPCCDRRGSPSLVRLLVSMYRSPILRGENLTPILSRLMQHALKIVEPDSPCLQHFISGSR